MTIHCQCSHCEVRMKLPAKLAGSKARCPKCKKVFLIQAVESESDVPADADVSSPVVNESNEAPASPPEPIQPGPEQVEEPVIAELAEAPPSTVGPPQVANDANEPMEAALPVAQAVPVESIGQPVESVPMATPVIESNATPGVGVVAPTKVRRPKSGAKGMMGFILGLFALLGCLAILAAVGYWLSTRGPQNGTVVIDIPVEHRSDCVLFVDGDDREISRVGPIEVLLAKGAHEVELRRLGFERIKMQVLVAARQELPIHPKWIPEPEETSDAVTEPAPSVDRPEPLDPVEAAVGANVGD